MFFQVKDFLSRFASIPDILELDHLTVSGDVTFGRNITLKVWIKLDCKLSTLILHLVNEKVILASKSLLFFYVVFSYFDGHFSHFLSYQSLQKLV